MNWLCYVDVECDLNTMVQSCYSLISVTHASLSVALPQMLLWSHIEVPGVHLHWCQIVLHASDR